MENGLTIRVGNFTDFELKVTRNKGNELKTWDEKWCNVEISVKSEVFNYKVSDELLLESEVDEIAKALNSFIEGTVDGEWYCDFMKGDIELEFHESDNDNPPYEAMAIKFKIMRDRIFPEDYYCLWLDQNEAKQVYDYLLTV